MTVAAVVPIRSFSGLTRLAAVLQTHERVALMRKLAGRTTTAIAEAGASVVVVTGDDEVRSWASESGFSLVDEPDPPSLDAAAAAGWLEPMGRDGGPRRSAGDRRGGHRGGKVAARQSRMDPTSRHRAIQASAEDTAAVTAVRRR